jgi:methylthioribose-1-phosphate isomerase
MAHDPTRRDFFRTFGRETMRNAGAVVGAAAELRRASSTAARELLDLGSGNTPAAHVDELPDESDSVASSFRSAYRLAEDSLLILDQRGLPGRLTILTCREPTEVASAIRTGAVNGGPVLGEVAAYALALAVAQIGERDMQLVDQVFGAAANTLRAARTDVHALRLATDRMEARYESLAGREPSLSSQALATALRDEADAIASEAQLAHATLGRSGADVIAAAVGNDPDSGSNRPINLLMHADMGPLSCGMVGTGTAILQSLHDLGLTVHVWLTEVAPSGEGSRIAALQLTQIDVPHTVIPDTAVAWLLSENTVHGALLRGDTVCANGDTLTPMGGLNVARMAKDSAVPVWIVAPSSAFAEDAVDGKSLILVLRSPAEAAAANAGAGEAKSAVFGVRLEPITDVVPASLVEAFLTESGRREAARA